MPFIFVNMKNKRSYQRLIDSLITSLVYFKNAA